jgi:hypothetical protein
MAAKAAASKKASGSFLKKRTKKLYLVGALAMAVPPRK